MTCPLRRCALCSVPLVSTDLPLIPLFVNASIPVRGNLSGTVETPTTVLPAASCAVVRADAWKQSTTARERPVWYRRSHERHPWHQSHRRVPQACTTHPRTDGRIPRLRGLSMPESTVWRHPDTIRTRTIDPSQPFPMAGTVRSRMTQDRHRTTRHQACRIPHSLVGTTDSPYARMSPPSDSHRLRHRNNLAIISPHNFTVSAGPFTLTALVPAFAAG